MIKPSDFTHHARKPASCNQIKSTQAPGMSPAFTNRRVQRLSPEEEKMIAEALEPILRRECRTKIQVYREYLWRCKQANISAASLRTFSLRLRGRPAYPESLRLSHILTVAQIEEMTFDLSLFGGESS